MEPADNQSRPQGARKRCPHCGGSNKADALWCGQCLEKFEQPAGAETAAETAEDDKPLDEEAAAKLLSSLAADTLTIKTVDRDTARSGRPARPTPPASVDAAGEKQQGTEEIGGWRVGEEGISWTCLRCETVNAMEERVCKVCGTNFAEAIQPEKDQGPPKDANKAALFSLLMPGAGHAYLGIWGEGIARAVISVWVVAVAIFSAVQGAGQARAMSILFGLVAAGLWITAAHDSHREATGMSKYVWLKRKFFLYLVLGLLLLSIVMIFASAIAASG